MPDTAENPLRRALTKFWSPIPWVLEAATILELVLGKYADAGIIAVLLLFNAALGFFQEGHAQATLTVLKKRLALMASVRRDGAILGKFPFKKIRIEDERISSKARPGALFRCGVRRAV